MSSFPPFAMVPTDPAAVAASERLAFAEERLRLRFEGVVLRRSGAHAGILRSSLDAVERLLDDCSVEVCFDEVFRGLGWLAAPVDDPGTDRSYGFPVSVFGRSSSRIPAMEALEKTLFSLSFSKAVTSECKGRFHEPLVGKPRYWWLGFVAFYRVFESKVPGLRDKCGLLVGRADDPGSVEARAVMFMTAVLESTWLSEAALRGVYDMSTRQVNSILRMIFDFCSRGDAAGVSPGASALADLVCQELDLVGFLDRRK